MTKSAGASVTAKAKELKKAVADNVRLWFLGGFCAIPFCYIIISKIAHALVGSAVEDVI